MSKAGAVQRITVLKEWLQQMERESKTFNRYRKTVKRDDDAEDVGPIKKRE